MLNLFLTDLDPVEKWVLNYDDITTALAGLGYMVVVDAPSGKEVFVTCDNCGVTQWCRLTGCEPEVLTDWQVLLKYDGCAAAMYSNGLEVV